MVEALENESNAELKDTLINLSENELAPLPDSDDAELVSAVNALFLSEDMLPPEKKDEAAVADAESLSIDEGQEETNDIIDDDPEFPSSRVQPPPSFSETVSSDFYGIVLPAFTSNAAWQLLILTAFPYMPSPIFRTLAIAGAIGGACSLTDALTQITQDVRPWGVATKGYFQEGAWKSTAALVIKFLFAAAGFSTMYNTGRHFYPMNLLKDMLIRAGFSAAGSSAGVAMGYLLVTQAQKCLQQVEKKPEDNRAFVRVVTSCAPEAFAWSMVADANLTSMFTEELYNKFDEGALRDALVVLAQLADALSVGTYSAFFYLLNVMAFTAFVLFVVPKIIECCSSRFDSGTQAENQELMIELGTPGEVAQADELKPLAASLTP
jgi:hypothetical protein